MKVVILPGNGCTPVRKHNFYAHLEQFLKKHNIDVKLQNMPDPYLAKESIWIPFCLNDMQCDKNTILVGHSSGAECAMRFMEKYPCAACFLVSPCVTDMGDSTEKASGYYDRPWLWDKMRENCKYIVQYGSKDDHLVPFDTEQKTVHDNLQPKEWKIFDTYGHFLFPQFDELEEHILQVYNELSKME